MSKMTRTKRQRAGYKILRTPEGLEIVTDKIGFRAPARKIRVMVTYQGQTFPVYKDSQEQIINPRRAFKKFMKEAEEEYGENSNSS